VLNCQSLFGVDVEKRDRAVAAIIGADPGDCSSESDDADRSSQQAAANSRGHVHFPLMRLLALPLPQVRTARMGSAGLTHHRVNAQLLTAGNHRSGVLSDIDEAT